MKTTPLVILAALASAAFVRSQETDAATSRELSTAPTSTAARIIGPISDATPPPPAPPKPEFVVPDKDILATTTLEQDGRTITLQRIKPIDLPPPPEAGCPTPPSRPSSAMETMSPTAWKEVPLTTFAPHKLEDPAMLADLNFAKWGFSQVLFGNLPVKIVPDANMIGTIGDVIDSTIANSDISHFVTPKQTEEHNQPNVELVAQGVTAGQFGQYFEWEGGDPGDAANKRKVKRNTHGMTDVGIKSKTTGTIVAKMRVWVVWSSASITPFENVAFSKSYTVGKYLGTEGRDHTWRFVFTVLPEELLSLTMDRPNLSGEKNTKVPGEGKSHFAYAGKKADSAKWKWDVSRQIENRIYNRQLIPKSQFPNELMYANQPVAEETVAAYPQNAAEGNDDPVLDPLDEDANPYSAFSGQGLTHAAGQISSCDGPQFQTPSAPVAAGASFVNLANFREFARLEIASKTPAEGATTWYRISDYKEWHHVLSSIYGQSTPSSQYFWGDAGSTSGEGKFNTQEEE